MKTNNKLLIYDDHCPLCVAYTSLFVKYKLLSPGNRVSFSSIDEALLRKINFDRAKDEIPLIDLGTGEVIYGIDALLVILGQRFSFVETIGKASPVYWLLKKLYAFISYNRKVIVAVKCGHGEIDCSPAFHLFYRLLLIMLSLGAGLFTLSSLHQHLLSRLPFYHLTYQQLLVASIMLILVNYVAAFSLQGRKIMEYLGQHAMLCLLSLLLLTPILLASQFIHLNTVWLVIYCTLAAIIIVREYVRRMRFVDRYSRQLFTLSINNTSLFLFASYLFNIL